MTQHSREVLDRPVQSASLVLQEPQVPRGPTAQPVNQAPSEYKAHQDPQGNSVTNGLVGPAVDTGHSGSPGIGGALGPQGARGPTGATGQPGVQGSNVQPGPSGVQGRDGFLFPCLLQIIRVIFKQIYSRMTKVAL